MMVQFNFGKMVLENRIRSIFDTLIAGQISIDGEYYCIHVDHKTKEKYALTREAEKQADLLGYPLDIGEYGIFDGEKVRAMTAHEENLYNQDILTANVDLWGNIEME